VTITSIHMGTIAYDPIDVGADRFASTGIIRDGVVNSALHKADEAGQARCAWSAPVTALRDQDGTSYVVPTGDLAGLGLRADVWYQQPLRGAYTPKVRASGKGYRLRIDLGGRSSAGHSCDFAVVVAPRAVRNLYAVYGGDPIYPIKLYSGVTSTTVAMLTADDGTRWMDVSQSVVDEALGLETSSTLTDIGGAAIALRAPMLEVLVLARTADVTSTPELHLFGAHEVVGS